MGGGRFHEGVNQYSRQVDVMTKDEFNSISWSRKSIVCDGYGHRGNVISVNFEYGVIHYDDNVKKCSFGRHYEYLLYLGENENELVYESER